MKNWSNRYFKASFQPAHCDWAPEWHLDFFQSIFFCVCVRCLLEYKSLWTTCFFSRLNFRTNSPSLSVLLLITLSSPCLLCRSPANLLYLICLSKKTPIHFSEKSNMSLTPHLHLISLHLIVLFLSFLFLPHSDFFWHIVSINKECVGQPFMIHSAIIIYFWPMWHSILQIHSAVWLVLPPNLHYSDWQTVWQPFTAAELHSGLTELENVKKYWTFSLFWTSTYFWVQFLLW